MAKAFRSNPTPEEARAWEWLRGRRAGGWHFRRQQVIEGFIVDFFCAKLRLVVEIDGDVHGRPDVAEYDRWRDEVLVARGLKVVRVPNHDLTEDLITTLVRQRQTEIAESPPPPRWGGGRGEGL